MFLPPRHDPTGHDRPHPIDRLELTLARGVEIDRSASRGRPAGGPTSLTRSGSLSRCDAASLTRRGHHSVPTSWNPYLAAITDRSGKVEASRVRGSTLPLEQTQIPQASPHRCWPRPAESHLLAPSRRPLPQRVPRRVWISARRRPPPTAPGRAGCPRPRRGHGSLTVSALGRHPLPVPPPRGWQSVWAPYFGQAAAP